MSPLLLISSAVLIVICGVIFGAIRFGQSKTPQVGALDGFIYMIGYLYIRVVHRAHFEIQDDALDDIDGPIIVVCNHTAGIDPFLASAIIPRQVRWLMAEDMRLPWLGWFWNWAGVIFVARNRHGRTGMRRARSHLQEDGIIGIFPEGKIERPHGRLLPFAPGVGVLVRRTGARVLPIVIEGTPDVPTAWESLWTGSNARVRVMKPIDYKQLGLESAQIAKDLENRFLEWTGWEMGRRPDPTDGSPSDSKGTHRIVEHQDDADQSSESPSIESARQSA